MFSALLFPLGSWLSYSVLFSRVWLARSVVVVLTLEVVRIVSTPCLHNSYLSMPLSRISLDLITVPFVTSVMR